MEFERETWDKRRWWCSEAEMWTDEFECMFACPHECYVKD